MSAPAWKWQVDSKINIAQCCTKFTIIYRWYHNWKLDYVLVLRPYCHRHITVNLVTDDQVRCTVFSVKLSYTLRIWDFTFACRWITSYLENVILYLEPLCKVILVINIDHKDEKRSHDNEMRTWKFYHAKNNCMIELFAWFHYGVIYRPFIVDDNLIPNPLHPKCCYCHTDIICVFTIS